MVTLLSITILVKLLQVSKAFSSIVLTPSGMVNAVSVLPAAYCLRFFPSLLYKLPSTSFKYLFLLEGVFDAIFVKNGLAVGSLKLSNKQQEILEQYKDTPITYLKPEKDFTDTESAFAHLPEALRRKAPDMYRNKQQVPHH